MITAKLAQLRKELQFKDREALLDLCLRLAKSKKENKELLTYLLCYGENETHFITDVQEEVAQQFTQINTSSFFYIKKSVRKILRNLKRLIKYSAHKETEVILLLYFCEQLKGLTPSITKNKVLINLYQTQLGILQKRIALLHPDLQFEYLPKLRAMYLTQAHI